MTDDDAVEVEPAAYQELVQQHIRWRAMGFWSLSVAILFAIVVGLVPVPFLKLSPGPMYNTIGTVDGKEMISITETKTYPVTGELNMTTVTERGGPYGGLTLPEAYWGWLHPNEIVAPVELFYVPGTTQQEAQEEGAADFTSSQSLAIAASLGYLDIPLTTNVQVSRTIQDGPSWQKLFPGDFIRSLNGKPITKPEQLPPLVRPMKPGSTAKFKIERGGKPMTVDVVVGENPRNPNWGYAGLTSRAEFEGPFPISFGVEGVGGPSAGLMFSLGIIDKLTEDNLANGGKVAGTGTIDPLGGVGPIGGITQKLYAARDQGMEIFLAPADNCESVREANVEDLNVVKVTSLAEAVDALKKWRAGDTKLPRC